ncbi:MAG: DUF2884 family protein [Arenimonas sp.]
MKRLALIVALGLGASFSAHAESLQCNFESDYTFSQQGRTLVFSRDAAPGKRIMILEGRLIVDGKDLALSAQDKQRIVQFENEMRLLIPQVKQVSSEAVDIAFTALIEVSRALNGEQDNPTVKKLQDARVALQQSIANDPALSINEDFGEKVIGPIVTDFIPDVVSAAVKQALSLAFSGDEKKSREFEARMDRMEKEIETKVEARAKKLEPMAQAMCSRVRNMDKIENGITVRLSNKEKINFLDTKAP